MRLTQLIESLDNYYLDSKLEDFEVSGISCNSKEVLPEYIFVAIKGVQEDGHRFIQEAIDKGAKAIVIQYPVFLRFAQDASPKDAEQGRSASCQLSERAVFIKVKDTRRALAKLAAEFYGNPSDKIKAVGITGTNGKTTVSYLIEAILKEANFQPAVIGTVNYRFKNKILPSKNTTPGPLELQAMLAQMLKENTDYAIIEVSSHALDQDRTEGINFRSAIFTNLTQDHLDYHKTLENYFRTKAKLFENIAANSLVIINNDDAYGRRLKELTPARVVTYAIDSFADIVAKDIKFELSHTEFILSGTNIETKFKTALIGRYNVYNILAAVAFALKEGIDLQSVKSAVEKFSSVPGRLERIDSQKGFCVFVDYAHTEDALKNVIKALRQLSKDKIIVVFGCGGERDKTKRPKMGKVVSELADYAIITNDNPRSEDPEAIIEDIKKGLTKNNYRVIIDRKEAIREALSRALTGDIVLVAGKGHENYQLLKDRTLHFDDREVIRECLKSLKF